MRIVISTILVWAILLGFFVTGVKVMATSPQAMPMQISQTADEVSFSKADLDRDAQAGSIVTPSGESRNGLRLNR